MPKAEFAGRSSRRLTVVPPGGGIPVVRLNGEETVLTVGEAETRGAYAARLNTAPPGFAAVPLHVHRDAEEGFLVLEGELAVHARGACCHRRGPARSSWYRGGSCTRSPIGAGCRCAGSP